jgi:hypothetical protein
MKDSTLILVRDDISSYGTNEEYSRMIDISGMYGLGIGILGPTGDYYLEVSLDGQNWATMENIGKKGKLSVKSGELAYIDIVDITANFMRMRTEEDMTLVEVRVARRFSP